MRTSTGSSLDRQTQAWAVTAGAPVTSTSVGGGRAEFVLHGEEPQTNSSANSDLRAFEAWMSWLHGSQPPDPDSCQKVRAFIRRAACRTAFPTPSPRSRHCATRKVEIRTVGLCACMRCGTSWTFTGKPPKRSIAENPWQASRSVLLAPSPFLDSRESCHINFASM